MNEEMEVRIVALLLGEASAFETAEIEQAVQKDPELAAFHAEMRRTIELAQEASKQFQVASQPAAEQPKLSAERREALLAKFREAKVLVARIPRPERLRRRWLVPASLAAGIIVLLSAISRPHLKGLGGRRYAMSPSAQKEIQGGKHEPDLNRPEVVQTLNLTDSRMLSESTVAELANRFQISGQTPSGNPPDYASLQQKLAGAIPKTLSVVNKDDASVVNPPKSQLRVQGGTAPKVYLPQSQSEQALAATVIAGDMVVDSFSEGERAALDDNSQPLQSALGREKAPESDAWFARTKNSWGLAPLASPKGEQPSMITGDPGPSATKGVEQGVQFPTGLVLPTGDGKPQVLGTDREILRGVPQQVLGGEVAANRPPTWGSFDGTTNEGFDSASARGSGTQGVADPDGHGTHVAGTVTLGSDAFVLSAGGGSGGGGGITGSGPTSSSKVELTGITTMFGNPRAVLEVSDQDGEKAASSRKPILKEGERDGSVEVLAIDVAKSQVQIRNGGVESNITFGVPNPSVTAPSFGGGFGGPGGFAGQSSAGPKSAIKETDGDGIHPTSGFGRDKAVGNDRGIVNANSDMIVANTEAPKSPTAVFTLENADPASVEGVLKDLFIKSSGAQPASASQPGQIALNAPLLGDLPITGNQFGGKPTDGRAVDSETLNGVANATRNVERPRTVAAAKPAAPLAPNSPPPPAVVNAVAMDLPDHSWGDGIVTNGIMSANGATANFSVVNTNAWSTPAFVSQRQPDQNRPTLATSGAQGSSIVLPSGADGLGFGSPTSQRPSFQHRLASVVNRAEPVAGPETVGGRAALDSPSQPAVPTAPAPASPPVAFQWKISNQDNLGVLDSGVNSIDAKSEAKQVVEFADTSGERNGNYDYGVGVTSRSSDIPARSPSGWINTAPFTRAITQAAGGSGQPGSAPESKQPASEESNGRRFYRVRPTDDPVPPPQTSPVAGAPSLAAGNEVMYNSVPEDAPVPAVARRGSLLGPFLPIASPAGQEPLNETNKSEMDLGWKENKTAEEIQQSKTLGAPQVAEGGQPGQPGIPQQNGASSGIRYLTRDADPEKTKAAVDRIAQSGKSLFEAGRLEEAEASLNRAIKFRDRNAEAKREMNGRMPDQQTLEKLPEAANLKIQANTYAQNGKVLFEAGRLDDAEINLNKATKFDPMNKAAFYYLDLIRDQRHGQANPTQEQKSKDWLVEVDRAWRGDSEKKNLPAPANASVPVAEARISQMENGERDELKKDGAKPGAGEKLGKAETSQTELQLAPNGLPTNGGVYSVNIVGYVNSSTNAQAPQTVIKPQNFAKSQIKAEKEVSPPKPSSSTPATPQPEINTRENAFSTFSLNVSDVSFKLAAASLENSVMPDPASIRVEEFVNAFNYHDPAPQAGARLAFAWERAHYPFAHNRDMLRFSIQTAARGREPQKPLNLVILLDNSGSMERSDRVQIVHEAMKVLAQQLQPQDRISVVAFARTPRLWVDGMAGGKPKEFLEKVLELNPDGGTNLEDALGLGYATAARHFLANGINRVILLTDGAANLGNVEPEVLKQKVVSNRIKGIALDCFGIGWEGYNDDLLEVLSHNGDGRYGFLDRPEEAAPDFANQLAGALNVEAADVKTQVEFNPRRVSNWRQIGYAKHQLTKEQFRDNKVDAAELAASESGNALYAIQVNPEGSGPIGVARVRYKIPSTGEYVEQSWTIPYQPKVAALDESSPAMRLVVTAAAFGEWLSRSPYAGEVTPSALQPYLNSVCETYSPDSRPQRLLGMIRQAQAIGGK